MTLEKIKNYLEQYEIISFAVIFGSHAAGTSNSKSDLDIGIYTEGEVDLLKLGRIISDLEKIAGLKIDILELNNLYKKSPLLSQQITSNHKVIFVRDEDVLTNFKRVTLLNFFDTEGLRNITNTAFYKRIEGKKFGKRNYA